MSLQDQVALITGSARGIGKTVAARLAAEGAAVVILDIDGELAGRTAAELGERHGVRAASFACDVSDFDQVSAVLDQVVEQFGRLDILVNNAGITRDSLLMRMKPEDWDLVLRINLKGAFNFIRLASRQMMKQRSGKIVNISSVVGLMGNAGQANYSASKAGMIGLTKIGGQGVRSAGSQGQCGRAGIHRDRDDRGVGGGGQAGLAFEHSPGPRRLDGRGGRGGVFPGGTGLRVHHRPGAAGRWRHGHVTLNSLSDSKDTTS